MFQMVEQEKFDREQLKNKRVIKGTPLYHLASRYGKYFALSLGAAHLALAAITYYSDVSMEFLTAGDAQIAEGAVRLGMYDKHSEDTEMRFEEIKHDLSTSNVYSVFFNSSNYIESLQRRYFSKKGEENTATEEGQAATANSAAKEAFK